MFKRIFALAAFAIIPILGACDADPLGPGDFDWTPDVEISVPDNSPTQVIYARGGAHGKWRR